MTKQTKSRGFTIVELLIVIVVIAILAAITIVAYNGIQNRARTSAGQSLANSVAKKVEAFNAIESVYPTLDELKANTGAGTEKNAADAKLDNASAVIAPTLNADNAANGGVVSYVQCTSTKGGIVAYWDYQANKAVGIRTGDTGTAALDPAAAICA